MTLRRTIYTIELLSDDSDHDRETVQNMDVSDIAYAISKGDMSGSVECTSSETVSREEMAELLTAQGSDPAFLLGEDYEEENFSDEMWTYMRAQVIEMAKAYPKEHIGEFPGFVSVNEIKKNLKVNYSTVETIVGDVDDLIMNVAIQIGGNGSGVGDLERDEHTVEWLGEENDVESKS